MARALDTAFSRTIAGTRLVLDIIRIESIIARVIALTQAIEFPVSYHYFPGHVTLAYLFAYDYLPPGEDECIIVLGTDQYWLRSPRELVAYTRAHAPDTMLIATPKIIRSVDDTPAGPLRWKAPPNSGSNEQLSKMRGDFLVSGTTLLNLTRMRAADTQQLYTAAVAWARREVRHPFFYQDQDFLNVLALFRPDVVLALPTTWNLMRCSNFFGGDDALPGVVHYNCGRRASPSRYDAYIQLLDSLSIDEFRSTLDTPSR
jgi:hypothetical protein